MDNQDNQMQISFKIVQNSSTAFWIQVKDQIGNYISSNNIPSGTRLPCVSELAKQAGVSLKTSERALIELVKEGICFRRPKKGTFVGSDLLQKTSSGASLIKADLIVFLVIGCPGNDPYHTRVLRGAEEMSTEKGLNLIYLSVPYNNDKILLEKLKPLAARKDLKAILVGGKLEDNAISLIENTVSGIVPVVIMGRTAGGFYKRLSHVTDSNGLAIRTALQFLYDSGHRRIAFLNGSLFWSWNREMREEFYRFIKGNGLPLMKNSIRDDLPDDEEKDGYDGILQIITNIKKYSVTSLVCATDKLAQGAVRGLKEKGFSVPGDISVIGLGNLEFGKYLTPALSTVDQCEEEKGREGVNIATGNYSGGNIIKVPVKLIVRDSTRGIVSDAMPEKKRKGFG